MRRLQLTCLGLFAVLAPFGTAYAGAKLAIVNVATVMEAAPEWMKARQSLENELKQEQARLEMRQTVLKEKKTKLDAQQALTAADVFAEKQQALFGEAQALTQEFVQIQQRLSNNEKRLTEEMLGRIEIIVREIGQAGEYAVVFEQGQPENPNVLYADKEADLTSKVVQLYGERYKGKSLASLPANTLPANGAR